MAGMDDMLRVLTLLDEQDLISLRKRWTDVYGARPSPRISRNILVGAIAYKLQERMFGGLSKGHKRRLVRHAGDVAREGRVVDTRVTRLSPGMRLIREWRGKQEEVEVLADGFDWAGRRFRSLSAVARAITGTGWSGPSFFGLPGHKKQIGSRPPHHLTSKAKEDAVG